MILNTNSGRFTCLYSQPAVWSLNFNTLKIRGGCTDTPMLQFILVFFLKKKLNHIHTLFKLCTLFKSTKKTLFELFQIPIVCVVAFLKKWAVAFLKKWVGWEGVRYP